MDASFRMTELAVNGQRGCKGVTESFQTAIQFFQARDWPQCIALCRRLLQVNASQVDAWQMLGLALCHSEQFHDAVVALESGLQLRPNDPGSLNNLGEVLRQAGQLSDAERTLHRAISLKLRFTEAVFNLGNTLRDAGRASEAIENYLLAVSWQPQYARAHLNLANLLRIEGRLPRAATHYDQFLHLQPARVDVLLSAAGVHADLGEHGRAGSLIDRAARLEPENEAVVSALAHSAAAAGETNAARLQYQRLASRRPNCLLSQLRVLATIPIIAPSHAAIHEESVRLLTGIEELREQRLPVNIPLLHTSGAEPPMAWAYQWPDNRPLKEAWAGLFADRINPLPPQRIEGKPKVGVVVTNGHEGVYSECLGRLVNRLPGDELDVSVICSAAGANILKHLLGESKAEFFIIPDRVDQAAARIHDARFDLLHYWEIGTDSLNYFLPFFKPAPIQSGCWGWPVTSGQPHVDYFVSSELIEGEDADRHYSETLLRFSRLPTWYKRPPVPVHPQSREIGGLPATGRLYLCTQNLRKIHPTFDNVMSDILRRDRDSTVCLIDDAHPSMTRQLRERLHVGLPDVASRVHFLPRRSRDEYLHTVAIADVILDTTPYGGGANSLFDAFACGTPVVTFSGEVHRSRFATGAYRAMDIHGLQVDSMDQYAEKAIAVASNSDWNQEMRQRLMERNDVLFEDDKAVAEHHDSFLEIIHRTRQNTR